jgi:cytosine deaminase
MDLLIRNALLRGATSTVDIGIKEGRIERVRKKITARPKRVIDAKGRLTTPSFVNAHTHLDKCMLGELKPNVSGTFDEAIRNTLYFRTSYTVNEIADRAGPVVELAVQYGSTFLRLFADVGTIGKGNTPVKGLLELKRRYADVIDIEVVAFPQEGIICDPGTEDLMREAMDLGADVVGGIPWFEWTDEDAREHVDICFDLAEEYGTPLAFLLDDTDDANARTLEAVAVKKLKSGFRRPVTVSHSEAMASWNNSYADKILRLCKQARINFSCNSHINVMLNGRFDDQPIRRGIMRVREMMALGINVLTSQDDVQDLYYPFGRMNQLEVAWFLGHAIQTQTLKDIDFLYDAITVNAARAMGLKNYGIKEGGRADLVIIDQPNVKQAIRFMGPILHTIRNGAITWTNGKIVRGKRR